MTTEASAVSEADTEAKQKARGAEPEPEAENKQNTEAASAAEPEKEQQGGKSKDSQAPQPGPADAAAATTSPEEEQLKPRTRTSAGKGLSRLFSSFLKRRSQCSEGEGFEAEKAAEEKASKEVKGEKGEADKAEEKKVEEKTDDVKEEVKPEIKVEEEKVEVKEDKKTEEKEEDKKVEEKKEDKKIEEKSKEEEKVEKKGGKKRRKESKKKVEEKGETKTKKGEEDKSEKDIKGKEEEKKEEKASKDVDQAQGTVEDKEKEAGTTEEKPKEAGGEEKKEEGAKEVKAEVGKETKEEEKVEKKDGKKKEKEVKVKKKEEEKAKKKAEEEEKAKKKKEEEIKKKEAEKTKKKEEEKAKEAEKAKKKEEEKAKEAEKAKKREEEKAKKKEEEKAKEAKKKEEEKAKEAKKKEEEREKEEAKKKKEKEDKKEDKINAEEEKGKKKDKGKKKGKDSEGIEKEVKAESSAEDQTKAPIAAPEPELKTEPEVEQAPDQHSVSSAEIQPAQEKHKEEVEIQKDPPEEGEQADTVITEEQTLTQEKEESKVEEEEGKEEEDKDKEKPVQDKKKEANKDAKPSKKQKTMQCKVTLLDDTQFECELDKHAKGQQLLTKVFDNLNLLEKDYFGLANWESTTSKTWLDPAKEIRKQVPGATYEFTFNVKFYPPDPAQLTEDITRYYLCLQLRKDIMGGVLPCSFVTLSLLGSYTAQSELGEFDPEVHGTDYVKELGLAPGQSQELEDKVTELHRTYRSMSPAQADMLFLENAKKLSMYGVDLHQAKDLEGVDIMLGVCSSGLMVYKDKLRINRFPWPKVLKISYKRSSFFIKIRASEQEQYESTIGFKLPNYKAAKKLWKVSVEHHTFFRVSSVEPPSSRRFLALGSKFRYSGRTQAQTRQASSMIDRPAPRFTRSASKRLSRNLDGLAEKPFRGSRPVSAPVFSQAALAEAGIPMAPLEQPQTSTPVKTFRQEDRKLEVTIEAVEPSKTEAIPEVKDFDKPQEDLLKHHASISELKRNFMEAVPEPRPSEWDKRLSTHSPLRTLSINGQPPPSADGVSADEKDEDKDCTSLRSLQTITSETTSGTTVTTTHISKVVRSGSSETRVEKRIVITADSEVDQDQGSDGGASAM